MKDSEHTSAASQAMRAQMPKGMSPMGKNRQMKQAHKSEGNMGMSDKSEHQVNGYKMGQSDGTGNY